MERVEALLVVDDNEDNRYTLTRRLRLLGYTNVATAENGEQALALLGAQAFDLVLLDIMMPGLSGYEVLERMRAHARWRAIPVIMISAVDEVQTVARCLELGAEDYLTKPFNPTLLRARVGATLEKKRLRDEVTAHRDRLERELTAARDIQLGMVPREFPPPTAASPVEIFASLQPAREIGGDLYDVFAVDPCTLAFLVADVSGKGAPAALFMARTKTMIRLVATLLGPADGTRLTPGEIVTKVNNELCRDNPPHLFVTLFLGMLEPVTGALSFCNAGHPPPFVLSRERGVVPLEGGKDVPLGIVSGMTYPSASWTLAADDGLFLFTDGITEAANGNGEFFAAGSLKAVLQSVLGEAPRKIVESVISHVAEFTGDAPPSDDIAAMALRRLAAPFPSITDR